MSTQAFITISGATFTVDGTEVASGQETSAKFTIEQDVPEAKTWGAFPDVSYISMYRHTTGVVDYYINPADVILYPDGSTHTFACTMTGFVLSGSMIMNKADVDISNEGPAKVTLDFKILPGWTVVI